MVGGPHARINGAGGVVAWHLSGRESFQLKRIMALDLDLDLDPGVRVYWGGVGRRGLIHIPCFHIFA